ncbi:MAG: VWA domain-containing protein [Chloroflexota bacterium]
MAGEVQLTCSTHRDYVPVLNQPQRAYVLLEMATTQAMANAQMPLNFCFVLDKSGSMNDDNKIGQLRQAVKHAIDLLQPTDIVSIIAFDANAKTVCASQTAQDKNRLMRKVDRLNASGGTQMAVAMRAGLKEVRRNLGRDRISRLVILTDGQTEGEPECLREAETAAREGIAVIALGLGADWNDNLLMDIAQRAQGAADYIASPEQIVQHFQQQVQAGQGAIIQNALLTLRLMQGIQPRKVWRVAPLIADLGVNPISDRDAQVSLGEMVKDQPQGVLVELLLPPRNEGRYRLAQADVSYDIPIGGIVGEHTRADVVLNYTSNPALAQLVNPRVMNIIEKVSAFKLQTRALQEAQLGDRAGATQKLRQAATMLLGQGEADLARTIQLEADRLEQSGQMSEEGKKTIKFSGGKTVRLG